MLEIEIPESEKYDEDKGEFIYIKRTTLKLEHSLVSIAKWESKWGKPFLNGKTKTIAETQDYIKCMTLTQNVDPLVYSGLTAEHYKQIREYINAPMTATWFNEVKSDVSGKKGNSEVITAEIIYYWMISLQIPFECQKWHFNRLYTLIKVCNLKNAPKKKMSRNDILKQNKAINDARRKALNSEG